MGYSTRSFAEQAYLDGHNVYSIDFFGDIDSRYLLQADYGMKGYWKAHTGLKKIHGAHDLTGIVKIAERIDFQPDAVCYTSNFENHPELIEELEEKYGGRLLGNGSRTVREVVNGFHAEGETSAFHTLKKHGVRIPETSKSIVELREKIGAGSSRILHKPCLSGGGYRIRECNENTPEKIPIDSDYYFQEYLEGKPCSAVFLANGKTAVLLGLSEQLIGDQRLGAHGFKYCGNVIMQADAAVGREAERISVLLTEMFSLKGLNGFDFILREGRIYFIELNPRYTASMELFADSPKKNLFFLHRKAFDGILPVSDAQDEISGGTFISGFQAKGIVYARRNLLIEKEPVSFFRKHFQEYGRDFVLKDVPEEGERIDRHKPVCSVLVRIADSKDVWEIFRTVQESLYEHLVSFPPDVKR